LLRGMFSDTPCFFLEVSNWTARVAGRGSMVGEPLREGSPVACPAWEQADLPQGCFAGTGRRPILHEQ
jgi:hypothetical protein